MILDETLNNPDARPLDASPQLALMPLSSDYYYRGLEGGPPADFLSILLFDDEDDAEDDEMSEDESFDDMEDDFDDDFDDDDDDFDDEDDDYEEEEDDFDYEEDVDYDDFDE